MGEYLKDKKAYVYVTDYLLSKNLNFFTGYNRHFTYYHSKKAPNYNNTSKIITLTAKHNVAKLRGVYVAVDKGMYGKVSWKMPAFTKTGRIPGNWKLIMRYGSKSLYWAR